MTVRSTQLAAVDLAAGAGTNIFTPPTGWRAIVKNLSWSLNGSTSGTIQAVVTTTAGATIYIVFEDVAPETPAGAWNGWVVMNAGDQLWIGPVGVGFNVLASGTLLQLTGVEPVIPTTVTPLASDQPEPAPARAAT